MRHLLLWGAGGHGKVVLDVARASMLYAPIAFVDDGFDPARGEVCGAVVLGSPDELESLLAGGRESLVVSIGNNEARARCFEIATRMGFARPALVHATAVVSSSARLGPGTVVMPRAVVNAGAEIGDNAIINTAAVVEHDCRIGDHVHISPGVLLGGGVTVRAFAHLGLGAIALPGAEIGEGAVVGAGSVILRNVPSGMTVAGVPARPTRLKEQTHDRPSLVA